jgi:hypothetical protein
MKIVQGHLALYQSGTDPIFNGALGVTLNAAERAEIVQMVAGINTLVADWEASHMGALQQ